MEKAQRLRQRVGKFQPTKMGHFRPTLTVGSPVEVDPSLFPVGGIDFYDGYCWVIDEHHHEIVQVDPETGTPTGTRITGFPGAAPGGLEIQY